MKNKKLIVVASLIIISILLSGCTNTPAFEYKISGLLNKVEKQEWSFMTGEGEYAFILIFDGNGTTVLGFDDSYYFDWFTELNQKYIGKNIEVTYKEQGSFRKIYSVKLIGE